jgi:hypothetical protein
MAQAMVEPLTGTPEARVEERLVHSRKSEQDHGDVRRQQAEVCDKRNDQSEAAVLRSRERGRPSGRRP